MATQAVIGEQQFADRPLKRAAAVRRASMSAVGRPRCSLARPGVPGAEDAENLAATAKIVATRHPACAKAPDAKAPVLGDVTNTACGRHRIAQIPRPGTARSSAVPSAATVAAAAATAAPAAAAASAATAASIGTAPRASAPAPAAASAVCAKPAAAAVAQEVPGLDFAPAPPPDHDPEANPEHIDDPQRVYEYVPDIFEHMHREELRYLPEPNYMDGQPHVNSKMRAILVDWLVDVHKKYKLRPETLFLAVGLVDRFLERRSTVRRHLQLVGVTALLIASKYEELYPPQLQDFIYITDKAYSKDEVLKMEVSMLTVLEFEVCRPTATYFMERFQYINGCTDAHRDLAQYLLELTLTEYRMIYYSPSHLAAASLLLSNKLLRRQPSWTASMAKRTGLTEPLLKDCAREICGLLELAETSQTQAVRKKFSQLKFHAVAKLNFAADSSLHRAAPRPASAQSATVRSGEQAPATVEARKCAAAAQPGVPQSDEAARSQEASTSAPMEIESV